MTEAFFELIQISVGTRYGFSRVPSAKVWAAIFDTAEKQSLVGVLLVGLEKLPAEQRPPQRLLLEWIGIQQIVVSTNNNQDRRSKELYEWFKEKGFDNCIIKGQGVARLYPEPELRQAGDIDIWVNADRDDIVGKMLTESIGVSVIDYVNCHVAFFDDVEVEVHFRPSYFFNPFANKRLQKWIQGKKSVQMTSFDDTVGFCYPTISFNLVFSLIHIYRHVFSEGIGLRQLMDYYYILKHSTEAERKEAFDTLCSLGLKRFVATVMYVMRRVFNIDTSLLLCQPNQKEGDYLLAEMLRGGNFGQYDDRNKHLPSENRMKRGVENVKRNLRFLKHYPSEVMWSPAFKFWHWCWRKWKGYL
jgi:hypothetical protein